MAQYPKIFFDYDTDILFLGTKAKISTRDPGFDTRLLRVAFDREMGERHWIHSRKFPERFPNIEKVIIVDKFRPGDVRPNVEQ